MTLEAWLKQLRAAPTLTRDEKQKVPTRKMIALPDTELDAMLDLVEVVYEVCSRSDLFQAESIGVAFAKLKHLVAQRG